jgi:hypothetical protein
VLPQEGATKPCPKCGQTMTFRNRTRVPGTGVGFAKEGGQFPDVEYRPAWSCANPDCLHYEE